MGDFITDIVSKNKLFFFLLLIGIVLRLYRFEGFMTFLGDQGRDALIVKNIVTLQHFPAVGAPSSVGQIYLGPFYYYLIAPFLVLSWFHPVGLGLGVAFMWILGIISAYFMVKGLVNRPLALLLSIFLLFSSPLIDFARYSWNPNLLPLFSFGTLYFFYHWLTVKKSRDAVLFGTFLALSLQLHYLALILFLPLFIWGSIFFFSAWRKKRMNQLVPQLFYAIASFIFFSLPLIIFDLRHNFLNSKNFLALFTGGKIAGENPYIQRLITTIHSFMEIAFPLHLPAPYPILLFIAFGGMTVFLIKKLKNPFLTLHALVVITYLPGFALLNSLRFPHYYGPVYLSFFLLLAGIPQLFTNKTLRQTAGIIMAAVFICIHITSYRFIWDTPNNQVAYAQTVAESFTPYITEEPVQIVALPAQETDGHFRYFLDLAGYSLLPYDSILQPAALYVICPQECTPLGDGQWQIAAFTDKELATSWKVEDVTIYKIVHKVIK